jgi:para-nitrobenzyl esterase
MNEVFVKTKTGTYVGTCKNNIQEFLGIRYATVAERWKPAKCLETTGEDIIRADKWGPGCLQAYDEYEPASWEEVAEDCLNLNIWTKDINTEGKPVFVFIHGGGFVDGGTHNPMYYGNKMLEYLDEEEDMVFVSINYRTNIFGSILLSPFSDYLDEYKYSNSLWIMDMVEALRWIHDNIEAFGGDNNNVTLCGQSCGAMAISYLLTMEETHQYFNKAIIQSGPPFVAQFSETRKREVSINAFKAMGAETIAEALSIGEDEIKEKYMDDILAAIGLPTEVFVDGIVIPKDWWELMREGSARGIKIMIGATNGENDWAGLDEKEIWETYIVQGVKGKGGSEAGYLINPVNDDGTPAFDLEVFLNAAPDRATGMLDLYNAMCYVQGSEYMAEALSEYTDVYFYSWQYNTDSELVIKYCDSQGLEADVTETGRPQHIVDLLFTLGTAKEGAPTMLGGPDDIPADLIRKSVETWYSFAKTGDPNNRLIPYWKTYNKSERNTMIMEDAWHLEKDPRKEQRQAFNCRPQGERVNID